MTLIGKPLAHESAREHVLGEAVYLDDLPPARNELLVDFVGSPLAHARIKSVDVSGATRLDGIVAVFTSADVPGGKTFCPGYYHQGLFAQQGGPDFGPTVPGFSRPRRETPLS